MPDFFADEQNSAILLLGLLADFSKKNNQVRVSDIRDWLSTHGLKLRGLDGRIIESGQKDGNDALKFTLDALLREHNWFGLGWEDSGREVLTTIGGVRWFSISNMYTNLIENKAKYQHLSDMYVEQAKKSFARFNTPRLLVDAGSTTFHCFFNNDNNCRRLRSAIKLLITNNLFVAFRWQEEFNDKGPLLVLGGSLNIDTAATLDHERLFMHLATQKLKPDIALLSWHFVSMKSDGRIEFGTKDGRESMVKAAALETARHVIIVFSHDKIVREDVFPEGGAPYWLQPPDFGGETPEHLERKCLFASQDMDEHKSRGREVHIITDFNEKTAPHDDLFDYRCRVVKKLKSKEFKDKRIFTHTSE